MKKLEKRLTKSISKNKVVTAIKLYEQYIDDEIYTIRIWSSTKYLINDEWNVDISTNKVSRCYNDPE